MRVFVAGANYGFYRSNTATLDERFAAAGHNSGNLLIAYGLLQTFRYDSVVYDPEMSTDQINAEFDVFVIAAANFLFSGFDFGYLADMIGQIRLPIVIVGLGAQSSSFDDDVVLQPGTERFVRLLGERCASIGVRGDYTRSILQRRGIENVQVTGCPSYHADLGYAVPDSPPPLPDHPRFVVNGSRDVIDHALDVDAMRATIDKLLATALRYDADFVAQTEHAEMVLAEGRGPDLSPCLDEVRGLFAGLGFGVAAVQAWALRRCRVFWTVPEWVAAMRGVDFSFGTRFHGNIATLLAGRPALVVCHDTRTFEMCRHLAVPHVDLATFNATPIETLYADLDLSAFVARRAELRRDYDDFLRANGLMPVAARPASASPAAPAI